MSIPALFKDKTFLPLFITQWIGAFNDNVLKSAFTFLVAYGGLSLAGLSSDAALLIGAAVYVAPFMLASGLSGALSDRFEKADIIRRTRLAEIALALVAGLALLSQSVPLLLICLFAYSTQSAFFGPAKYSILPEVLREDQLIEANAWLESSTFMATLFGLLFGGFLAGNGHIGFIAGTLFALAAISYAVARMIPPVGVAETGEPVDLHPVSTSITAVKTVFAKIRLFRSAVGLAWFWSVGLVVLTVFPDVAKSQLNVSANVANVLIASFVVGIAMGTAAVSRMLKGVISARHVPIGALGMAIFLIDLAAATNAYGAAYPDLADTGFATFISSWEGMHVVLDMVAIAAFGGVFTVPLYAILQAQSEDDTRSTAIAGSNIISAAMMVVVTLVATLLMAAGISVSGVLVVLGIVNVGVAIYVVKLVPDEVIKSLGATLVKLLFGARVENIEAYGDGTEPAVVIANHTSFLDAILLGCLLPGKPAFAINSHIAQAWWVKPAFLFFDLVPVDPASPFSVRKMVKIVRDEGRRLVIFPEGRLTVTGSLMKVYDGPAMIAAKADAPIIPVRIDGAQYSKFSRLAGKLPLKWFPKVRLTVLPKTAIQVPEELFGRARRAWASRRLHDVMTDMVFETSNIDQTLFGALIDAGAVHGKRKVIEDIERNPIGYRRIITGAFALGAKFAENSEPASRLGLLLPNSSAAVVSFFACHAYGRTPAMLNFTAGAAGVEAALTAAEVKTVITSRRFVEIGKLGPLVDAIGETAKIVYLEDLREKIGLGAKLWAALKARVPKLGLRLSGGHEMKPAGEAVVLFTSGSEGLPKGVVLSHRNIQANRYQVSTLIDFSAQDTVLNALPMFHSFGLTAGTLLPLLSGVKIFLYPSPLHYRIVPEIAYDTNATIMFGTDTFLSGYARLAHAYDFYSLRYAFAGAERVRPETRAAWAEKFGVRILEGYGTTETAPVLAINTPMNNQPGTVGRLLPAMETRLEPVEGVDEGGRLHVRGPNVMLGYLKVDNPGVIQPPEEGWHDTGDIVTIDDHGFIAINGRAKRFAKIAGEMVSLASVEALAGEVWPGAQCIAVALPHEKKGEQVILLSEAEDADARTLSQHAKSKGIGEIMVPKTVLSVEAIPMLGTGKMDLGGAKKLAEDLFGKAGGKKAPARKSRSKAA
jgi:acyl-[acyl-carrier-protein]-phospholipid O-acyltransferase/long-chain-fatty-acid--[acyl-carrier-protein] ligase